MGFTTTPITVEQAKKLVTYSDGEVVSASKEEYFDNLYWFLHVVKVAIKDDSITLFFTLDNEDFVEYCCVKSEDMTRLRELTCITEMKEIIT